MLLGGLLVLVLLVVALVVFVGLAAYYYGRRHRGHGGGRGHRGFTGPTGGGGETGPQSMSSDPQFRLSLLFAHESISAPGVNIPGLTGLVNPMGLALDPDSSSGSTDVFWVANNTVPLVGGQDTPSNLMQMAYSFSTATGPTAEVLQIVYPTGVTPPAALTDVALIPTGTTGFMLSANGMTGTARIVSSDQFGRVFGYNPAVSPYLLPVINFPSVNYFGCEFINSTLYLPNWQSGNVEMYGPDWTFLGEFTDVNSNLVLEDGYHPYTIHTQGGLLYVGFAQNDGSGFPVASQGNSFVTIFDPSGNTVGKFQGLSYMNDPAGYQVIPPSKSPSGTEELWISNWGNGFIDRYNLQNAFEYGLLKGTSGDPSLIPQLHAILFPPRANATPGTPLQVIFSAGPLQQNTGILATYVQAS
jgi:hypothetical protein